MKVWPYTLPPNAHQEASRILEFQIAVARLPGIEVSESLSFILSGKSVEPAEIVGEHGSRTHRFDAEVGDLQVRYSTIVTGRAEPPPVREVDLKVSSWAGQRLSYGPISRSWKANTRPASTGTIEHRRRTS